MNNTNGTADVKPVMTNQTLSLEGEGRSQSVQPLSDFLQQLEDYIPTVSVYSVNSNVLQKSLYRIFRYKKCVYLKLVITHFSLPCHVMQHFL